MNRKLSNTPDLMLSDNRNRVFAITSLAIPLFCLLMYVSSLVPLALGTNLNDAPLAALTAALTIGLYLFLPIILGPALFITMWVVTQVQGKYKAIALSAIALDIILWFSDFWEGPASHSTINDQ